jgi:hypothetical protein
VHHAAFKGPAHYYRDIVNEDVVIHFHIRHVGLILLIAAAMGTGIVSFDGILTFADGAFVLGMVIAAAIGYLGYEINHHYMHVIGERRLAINRVLGDIVQGGRKQRDGKLRFSKPLLDASCNLIERLVDRYERKREEKIHSLEPSLKERFKTQMRYNIDVLKIRLKDVSAYDAFNETLTVMLVREKIKRRSLNARRRFGYWIDRRIQHMFRGSDLFIGQYFRHIDNNHFMHHYTNSINLNVFMTWADIVFGTRRDSSEKALESQYEYWLCPNSPDIKRFILPERC